MVRELERVRPINPFPETAPAANPVFFRTYSRRTPSGRETWEQVSDRILQGLVELGKLTPEEAATIDRMQRQIKALPSGRWLWVGGTDWMEKPENFSGGYNCFAGDTLVNTLEFGAQPIASLVGRKVSVLNRFGQWTPVEFGQYGEQPVWEITLRRGVASGELITIQATPEHRWFVSANPRVSDFADTRTVSTAELQAGNYLRFLSAPKPSTDNQEYLLGIQHGIVYADGSIKGTKKKCDTENFKVRLCGEKSELLPYFPSSKVIYCPSYNGDPLVMLDHENYLDFVEDGNLKQLPYTSNPSYLLGFLHGLLAADGSVNNPRGTPVVVINGSLELCHWLTTVCPIVGIEVGKTRCLYQQGQQSNYGIRKKAVHEIKLYVGTLTAEDFLRQKHKNIFGSGLKQPPVWRVLDVQDIGITAPVYCCEEPETHGFVLTGGIETGNCTSSNVVDWRAFGLMMDLAMMGCGTGAVLEPQYINQLPPIRNPLNVTIQGEIGLTSPDARREETEVKIESDRVYIYVGDSRQGWVKSYQTLLELSTDERFSGEVQVSIDLSDVRPAGERLKGFGGVANPIKLPGLYERCAAILNKAVGRQLNSVECCLLIDEAAVVVVAGNVRRSAGMRQGSSEDELFANAKANLWQQDAEGNWRIDPERDSLRMANHSRVFNHKPTLEECIDAVRQQYYSGEGAIQWAGESVARANCDLLINSELKTDFLKAYALGKSKQWMQEHYPEIPERELDHRLARYGLNPCVTADTWVHTEQGARQVKDLIGKQLGVYVNGELFSTTPNGFWFTGIKPVFKLITQEGYELRLTSNHQLLKLTAQTQKKQYSEWVELKDLKPGDRILVHNHRGVQPWDSFGTFEQGWLLGNLIGDGSLASTQWGQTAYLRYWENSQDQMGKHAVTLLKNTVGFSGTTESGCYHQQLKHRVINSSGLAQLANEYGITLENKMPTPKIEQASYEFTRGFLRGLFDADGSVQGSQQKGASIRLAQSNLQTLKIVQRMLARLGIISTIYQNRRPEGYRPLPNSNRESALYFCQAQHELVIANDNIYYYQKIVGFQEPQKAARLQELLSGYKRKVNRERFAVQIKEIVLDGIEPVYDCTVPGVSQFDANGLVAHNCGEIIGSDFHCNLSEIHLNQLDPDNNQEQEEAFTAGALSVAVLLNHKFIEPRYQYSRELDPIVGVSFTGLFDFFVKAFGVDWLRWWAEGRPETAQGLEFKRREEEYLTRWREIVHRVVWEYCDRHNIKRPNRCTTVQPSGTKSLLTNASPGWHPPKAQRFIRRITFRKNDPVALACIDYGYNVVPSQSDKDENGNLLNDPFDPRVTEWLVEIPVSVVWADLPGAEEIDISKFSALAQMDFYMQVQKFYVRHNTSATIELRESEIEPLGTQIYQAIRDDEGYISAALLARFDDLQTFPRLPFEPIAKQQYEQLMKQVETQRKTDDFHAALSRYDLGELTEAGPAGCDSDKCLMPEQKSVS